MGRLDVRIKNFEKLQKDLDAINAKSQKVMANTINDMKRRAPGWVAGAVTKTYNIKPRELRPASKTAKHPPKKAGTLRIKGDTIESFELIYSGRRLTPIHFGMDPDKRPTLRLKRYARVAIPRIPMAKKFVSYPMPKPYTVSLEIFKGARKTLKGKANGQPVFIAPNGHGTDIAYQRKGEERTKMTSIHSVSVPQMVQNKDVATDIQKNINKGVEKRLQHNLNRALGTGKK